MIARLPNIINFSQIFLEGNRMGSTLAAKLPAMSNATKLSTHKVHQFIKQCWEASRSRVPSYNKLLWNTNCTWYINQRVSVDVIAVCV